MKKYDFSKEISRYGSYCTQWDYAVDRFGNENVIPFSISDMDIPLPQEAIEYLQSQLSSGIYGYTRWKNEELLSAIEEWYQKRFDYKLSKGVISYSPSVIYSIGQLIRLQSCSGENVLILTPAYDAFFNIITENDRRCIRSELVLKEDQYLVNWPDLELKLKESKILLFCSPHNPVGKVWNETELVKIINLCKVHDVTIISDEIHMDFSFNKPHFPILKIAERESYIEKVSIATSATKSFNFPALLFSYVLIPNAELKLNFEQKLKQANGLSSCTSLGMHATVYAYKNLSDWLDQLKEYIESNLHYLQNYLNENKLNLKVNNIDGTYLVWIDGSYYCSNFELLKKIMYEEAEVGIMDGDLYGKKYHLRINIGCPRQKLVEGLNRINSATKIWEERSQRN